jgi:hypothetical protein
MDFESLSSACREPNYSSHVPYTNSRHSGHVEGISMTGAVEESASRPGSSLVGLNRRNDAGFGQTFSDRKQPGSPQLTLATQT